MNIREKTLGEIALVSDEDEFSVDDAGNVRCGGLDLQASSGFWDDLFKRFPRLKQRSLKQRKAYLDQLGRDLALMSTVVAMLDGQDQLDLMRDAILAINRHHGTACLLPPESFGELLTYEDETHPAGHFMLRLQPRMGILLEASVTAVQPVTLWNEGFPLLRTLAFQVRPETSRLYCGEVRPSLDDDGVIRCLLREEKVRGFA